MRRIPRPQRSIDQIAHSSHLRIRAAPLSCQSALTSPHLLRATSAPFSTSTRHDFLGGQRDPKKYKASIRKWQKRLTGDSEPIGSHVDPFDPTSPIRIRPEEQGPEEEVLAEAEQDEQGNWKEDTYEKAKSGEGLERIGSEEWVKKMEDAEVATPVIRKLDRRLRMPDRVTKINQLRWYFIEAFSPYYEGQWDDAEHLEAARLAAEKAGNPKVKTKSRKPSIEDAVGAEDASLVFDEPESTPPETSPAPVIGGALVKQAEGKPFDFMSNRPVPRAKPVEAVSNPEPVVEQVAPVAEASPVEQAISAEIESAAERSRQAIADARHEVLTTTTQRTADAIAKMREEVLSKKPTSDSDKDNVIFTLPKPKPRKWRDLPLTDPKIKLKIYKTLVRTTNLLISDNNLHSARTLGELYSHLVAASKPKPTKLYQQIQLEATLHPQKAKPGMEQLTKLSNVTLHKKKITEKERERKLGRWKVIEYALAERDLPLAKPRSKKADWWLKGVN